MYANKLQEKFILNAKKQKAEKEKKKAVSTQKTDGKKAAKKTTLQEPFTNEALINQQKAKYDAAQDDKDTIGKRAANIEADKIREAAKMPLYSSAVGDAQAAKTIAKNPIGLKQNISRQMVVNNETKQRNTVLGQMFDKKENYIDKAKKGNIKGAALNLVGAPIQAAQSTYLNALNNVDSTLSGKGLQPFKYNMDFTDYENSVATRHGVNTITQDLGNINSKLGTAYNIGMNIATDPLNLLDGAGLLKVKGINTLGSADYSADLLKGGKTFVPTTAKSTMPVLLPNGKTKNVKANLPVNNTSGFLGQVGDKFEVSKPISAISGRNIRNLANKDTYINDIVEELGARHNPRNLKTSDMNIRDNEIAQELDKVANMTESEFREYAKQNRITSGQLPQLHKVKAAESKVAEAVTPLQVTPQKQYDDLLKEFQANFKSLSDEQKLAYQAKFEELRPSKTTELPKATNRAENKATEQVFNANQASVPKANETPLNANLNSQKIVPNKLPNKLGNLYEKTVDSQHTIGKSVEGVEQTADKNAKILASNARNARGTVDYSIKNGLVDMEGKQVAKTPLQTVFETVPDKNAFNDYLLHKHNIDRFREGKPIFGNDVTSADSAEIVKQLEKQYPQFAEYSGAVNENSNLLIDEWLVKNGLISKELGEKLKLKYKNYVPAYREGTVKADGYNTKGLKANTVVKTAVGGDKPVIAPNVSIGIQMSQVIKAVRKNEIYQGLLDAVRKDPDKMANYAKLVDTTTADAKYANTITKNAVDDLDLEDIEKVASDQLSIDEKMGKYYVTAMEKGKPVRIEVAKELFDSLKSLDGVAEGTLDKFAQGFRKGVTNPFKALITGYNPFFALRNIARDIPTSYIQGTENNPLKWAKNLGDAAYNMAKNTDEYKEYKALGGKQSGYFNAEKGITSENLPTKALRKVGQGISAFNEATETLPRFGEYLGTLKREGTDYAAKQQGIYNAGEATVNFARNGEYTKAADAFIPYLNPAVQGIDKSMRTFSNPKNVAKAIGMVSVPSTAIYALNHKTEEDAKNYAMLDNRTKDTYFVFPTGGGEFIKIPKSREAGVLFSDLPERILRAYQGNENAFKGFGNTVATNFAPQNPIENNLLFSGTLDIASNKDFANRAIVPINMLNDKRSKYLQYDETTSELTKWLGEEFHKIGLEKFSSPKQIEHIIDSYTGIIGDIVLPATTKGENPIENVLTKPFTADTVYNNELQNTFYEDFDKATREKTDLNLTQDIPTEWRTPEEKKVSSFNKTSLAMGDIRKEINKQRASGASKDELKGLRGQLNDLAINGSSTAEQTYQDYLKTYIPEISGMSDKQKQGYAEYAQPQGISAADFNSANTQAKEYRTSVSKIATILNAYPENGEAIAMGLGYSKGSIQNAKLFAKQGIEPTYYEKYKQLADANGDGKIKAKEAHDILKNEDLTTAQRAYLIRMLQGAALKEKN